MRSLIFSLVFGVALAFGSTTANATDIVLDEEVVVGFDVDKKAAREEAQDLLDDAIDEIDDNLPPGWAVVGVNTSFSWDGIGYEIKYEVIISDD